MRRGMSFAFGCLFGAALSLSAHEQKAVEIRDLDSAWQRVSQIRPAQRIKIHLIDGKQYKDDFVEADSSGVVLKAKDKKTLKINREEIRRISRKSEKLGALARLAAGMAGGALAGAARAGPHDMSRAGGAGLCAMGFGAIGALAGGIIGIEQTIYVNPAAAAAKRK